MIIINGRNGEPYLKVQVLKSQSNQTQTHKPMETKQENVQLGWINKNKPDNNKPIKVEIVQYILNQLASIYRQMFELYFYWNENITLYAPETKCEPEINK